MSTRRLGILLGALLVVCPLVADAQQSQQTTTLGLLQGFGDAAGGQRPESALSNPATLAFAGDWNVQLLSTQRKGDVLGDGLALLAHFGLFDRLHTALGLTALEVPGPQRQATTRLDWITALKVSDAFALAVGLRSYDADPTLPIDDVGAWDLGLTLRPIRWLALGATLSDVNAPLVGGQAVDRQYGLAVALRPGIDALTLSGDVRAAADGDLDPQFGGNLSWAFWGPLRFVGRYVSEVKGEARAHRVMAGLEFQVARAATVGAQLVLPEVREAQTGAGYSTAVSLGGPAGPLRATRLGPQVLELGVRDALDEYAPAGFLSRTPATPFLDLLRDLQAAAHDDDIQAVLLGLTDLDAGWGQAEELRRAITAVRATGKLVYAYIPVVNTKGYFVASAADKIFTAPAGGLLLTGIRADFLYLGNLFSRLGVRAQFVAIGDYKTAPETFTREGPSDAAREMENWLLDDLYGRLVAAMAVSRGKSSEAFAKLIDAGPYTAEAALKVGLVDGVLHYDEFEGVFRQTLGASPRFIDASTAFERREGRWGKPARVAVLYVVGTITDGESVSNLLTGSVSTGADTFVQSVRAIREDHSVAGVVLRIDSPGGSVTASDVMWRELRLLAAEKPMVVSMGDVAASGGYYVAAIGAPIFATPETITGSIGIFTGKFDLSGLFGLLGVHREGFERGAHAGLLSEMKPWSDSELAVVQEGMETLYQLFLRRIVESRPTLTTEAVDAVGRGRVFTGGQAMVKNLVDVDGGLLDAIARTASLCDLGPDDYDIVAYPEGGGFGGRPRSPLGFEALTSALVDGLSAQATRQLPPALRQIFDLPLLQFQSGQAMALLPFVFVD